MAELAASIFTLAKAATKLPDTLRIAISIIRSAESESRAIAADIQSFSLYLTQASKLVEDLDAAQTKTLHEISTILVPACHALIHKLEHLIGPLMPFGAKRGLVAQWVRFYYAWIVNRRDVAFIRELIESFKSTLGLLLTTMTLAVAIHREAPHDTCNDLKEQVQSSIGFAQDAHESLRRFPELQQLDEQEGLLAERAYSATETNCFIIDIAPLSETSSGTIVTYSGDIEDGPPDLAPQGPTPVEPDFGVRDLLVGLTQIFEIQARTIQYANDMLKTGPENEWSWGFKPTSSFTPRPPGAEKDSPRVEVSSSVSSSETSGVEITAAPGSASSIPEGQGEQSQGRSRIRNLDGGSGGSRSSHFDDADGVHSGKSKSVPELEELVRRLVEQELRSSRTGKPSAEDAQFETPPGAQKEMAPTTHTIVNEWEGPPRYGRDRAETGSSTLALMEETIHTGAARGEAKHESKSTDLTKKIIEDAKFSKLEKLIWEQQIRREAKAEAMAEAEKKFKSKEKTKEDIKKEKLDQLDKLIGAKDKEDKRRYEENKQREEEANKLPIKFQDASGQTFAFPWGSCKTWTAMEELINQAFLHDEDLSPRVQKGQYELIDADGNIVLPLLWETAVRPESTITIRMLAGPEKRGDATGRKQGWARLGLDRKKS